jgi:hypothetical protein
MGLKPPLDLEGPKIGFCSTPALIAGAAADSDLTAGGSDTDSDSSTTRSLIETHLEKGTKQGNMSEVDNAWCSRQGTSNLNNRKINLSRSPSTTRIQVRADRTGAPSGPGQAPSTSEVSKTLRTCPNSVFYVRVELGQCKGNWKHADSQIHY